VVVDGVVVGVVVGDVVVDVDVGALVGVVTPGLQTMLMLVADCSVSDKDAPVQVIDAVPPALKATVDESLVGVADSLMSGAATAKPTTAAATGTKNLRIRDMVESALFPSTESLVRAIAGQATQSELTFTSHRVHISVIREHKDSTFERSSRTDVLLLGLSSSS
jgi:hypothetical protein